MLLKALRPFSLLFVLIFLPQNSYASSGFLTLQFAEKPPLMQGWYYNFGSKTHQGIDYYANPGTDLVASADGSVNTYYQPGNNFVYGKYLIIDHGNGYKSLYAHLSEIMPNISNGTRVKRGDILGKSGMSGTDNPHLHFESLATVNNGKGLNRGYGWRTDPYDLYSTAEIYPPNSGYKSLGSNNLWLNGYPEIFIKPEPPTINVALDTGAKVNISWVNHTSQGFEKYELQRSMTSGAEYQTIYSTSDINQLSYQDLGLVAGKTYHYRVVAYFANGLMAESEEKSIEIKREIINISQDPKNQQYPTTDGKIIVWQDWRKDANGNYPRKLFYYDIAKGEVLSANIAVEGVSIAQEPRINGNYACYTAQDNMYYSMGTNIYCYDFKSGVPFKVTGAPKDQLNPEITDDGIVFWEDKRNGSNFDLYYLDLTKSQGEVPFVVMGGNQSSPKISGNKVIWKDTRVGNRTDLYLKEVGGATEVIIKTNIGSNGTIDFWGDWVAWSKDNKLNLINIVTKEEKVICDSNVFSTVRVDSGKVAYTKSESGYYWIHVYAIASGTEEIIDFPCYYLPRVDLSGNVLVFDTGELSTIPALDIYLTYL